MTVVVRTAVRPIGPVALRQGGHDVCATPVTLRCGRHGQGPWQRDPARRCAQYRLAQHGRRCDWRATALELCCTARRCALIALARVVPIPRRWKCKCQRMFLLSYCATGCSQPGTTSEAASTQRYLSLGAEPQDGAAVWGQRESSAGPPEIVHAQGYQRAHVMHTLLPRRGPHTVAASPHACRSRPPIALTAAEHVITLEVPSNSTGSLPAARKAPRWGASVASTSSTNSDSW